MAANCFLVRYAGGWAERKSSTSIATNGRIEALLGLGALSSLAEVNRVADGQLDDFALPREQTDIVIDPRWAAEAPYVGGPLVGDVITAAGVDHRMLAVAISEDQATGRVQYVPSLNENVVLEPMSRISQALTKMVRGTLGGRSQVAQPVVPQFIPRGRAPAPGVSYLETFPNDGFLSSTTEDLTWNVATGFETTTTVASSHGTTSTTTSQGNARAEHDTVTEDMFVQCDWVAGSDSTNALTLIGRCGNTAEINGDAGIYLSIFTDSGECDVAIENWGGAGSFGSVHLASSPIATWRLELDGDTGRGYRNDVLVLTADTSSVSPVPTGKRAGYLVVSFSGITKLEIDNFEFGDL